MYVNTYMGRKRIQQRDGNFWQSVRLLLDEVKLSSSQSWAQIAISLGVSKQALTGFRKSRVPALDAEAVLRLCSRCNLSLVFEGQTISSADAMMRIIMEFDRTFQLEVPSAGSATLTRTSSGPPSFIEMRLERVFKGPADA